MRKEITKEEAFALHEQGKKVIWEAEKMLNDFFAITYYIDEPEKTLSDKMATDNPFPSSGMFYFDDVKEALQRFIEEVLKDNAFVDEPKDRVHNKAKEIFGEKLI